MTGIARPPAKGRLSLGALSPVFGLLVLVGCGLCLAIASAPGPATRFAVRLLSVHASQITRSDQRVHELLYVIAVSCVGWGVVGLAWCSDVLRARLRVLVLQDTLLRVSPRRVLIVSALVGVAILLLYEANRTLDVGVFHWLFGKEGPLEWLTAGLYGGASALMAMVAWRLAASCHVADGRSVCLRPALSRRSARGLSLWFGVLAAAFFFIAGEEISWGQQAIGFATPKGYEQINTQSETNLHNLLSKAELDSYTRQAAIAVFVILLFGWVLMGTSARPVQQFFFPPPSLLPLAYLTFIIGPQTHLEVFEIMSGVFAVFYVWRVRRGLETGEAA